VSDQGIATRRLTGMAGLGAAVFFAAGSAFWAFEQPAAGARAGVVLDFYANTSTEIIVGASFSLVAIALFVFFASGLRVILQGHEGGDLFATAALGRALVTVAAGLGAETINMVGAVRAADGQLSPDLARALFEISYVLGYNAAGVGIGILLLAVAAIALSRRTLMHRSGALALLIVGLSFLTPLSRYLLGPSVVVLAALSVRLAWSSAPAE
jgi:hypothetical protein